MHLSSTLACNSSTIVALELQCSLIGQHPSDTYVEPYELRWLRVGFKFTYGNDKYLIFSTSTSGGSDSTLSMSLDSGPLDY